MKFQLLIEIFFEEFFVRNIFSVFINYAASETVTSETVTLALHIRTNCFITTEHCNFAASPEFTAASLFHTAFCAQAEDNQDTFLKYVLQKNLVMKETHMHSVGGMLINCNAPVSAPIRYSSKLCHFQTSESVLGRSANSKF